MIERRHAWCVLALLLLWIAGPDGVLPAKTRPGRASFAPDPLGPGAPPLEGDAFKVETPQFAARLALLDDASRQAFLKDHAGASTDPFATPPTRPQGFLTFLLEIESRSDGSLVFQPLSCLLVVPGKDMLHPLDLATLKTSYEMLERTLPPAYSDAWKGVFDGEVHVAPGGRASGLLVYRAVDPKTRAFELEVSLTTHRGEAVGFQAPYRRVKGKEDRKAP